MGAVASTENRARAQSERIDKWIEEDCQRLKRECRVLLLGLPESGKSTIVQQMKIMHSHGFSEAELAEYRPVVYKNVLDFAQQMVGYMRMAGIECIEHQNRVLAQKILDYRLETRTGSPISFPQDIAEAIHQLWNDPIMNKIMNEHSSDCYLTDSAGYFFGEVLRIASPSYLPNQTDVLLARQKSVGFTETSLPMGQLTIRIIEVGNQKPEPWKWIHQFQDVTSILFCTALSDYDQVPSDKAKNTLEQSIELFESVINSRWFVRTSIILFLNKLDLFKNKIQRVPLELYFADYTGGLDANKGANYILWKFMQANRARLTVYPHLTQATDTIGLQLLFKAMKETILQNALKDSEIV